MKFQDYPHDLQRIVKLTPEGISKPFETVRIDRDGEVCFTPHYGMDFRPKDVEVEAFTPDLSYGLGSGLVGVERSCQEYEQCRAQWLAEKSEVDWRGLCEELTTVIDGFIEMWDGPKYAMHMIENVQAARPVADKARKALEQTK